MRKPMKYAAAKKARRAAKEASMGPQSNETRIPDRMTLQHRPVCAPRADERPLLRDEQGHVLAQVEQWRPEVH